MTVPGSWPPDPSSSGWGQGTSPGWGQTQPASAGWSQGSWGQQPGAPGWPAGAPGAPSVPRIRPGPARFVIAGVLVLAGIALAIVLFVRTAVVTADRIDGFDRMAVPGRMVVDVTSPGGYTLYAERPGGSSGSRPLVFVDVSAERGQPTPLVRAYDMEVTYDMRGHSGVALYSVQVDAPGRYLVEADGAPGTTLAFGRGIGQGILRGVALGIALGGALVLAGAVLAIVSGVQRSRSRRAALAAGTPWGGGPPAATPWGPGQPQQSWQQASGPGGTASWGSVAPGAQPPPPPPPPP